MLPLSLFAYDGTGYAGMQEEFLTSVAQIKKKLRLDMDSASVRLTVCVIVPEA
jgi:tRNA U38,U39,U40 pseudouridine synthase TruA